MIIFKETADFLQWRNNLSPSKAVSFVPTMGNLHEGHLSLVQQAAHESDIVVISIFVNPKQFGPTEDLDKYPRTFDADYTALKFLSLKNEQCDFILYAPKSMEEVYDGFDQKIIVDHPMTKVLCGAYRSGHFDGVTTVVYRLLDLVKPYAAYFGEKDYQQLAIIKKMVKEQHLDVLIKSGPIVRAVDGLALSSRNQYLSSEERVNGLKLSHSLNQLKSKLETSKQEALEYRDQLLKEDSNFQYLEILNSDDLSPLTESSPKALIAGAYLLGKTRIIDNVTLELLYTATGKDSGSTSKLV